jgi:hypothetical protein
MRFGHIEVPNNTVIGRPAKLMVNEFLSARAHVNDNRRQRAKALAVVQRYRVAKPLLKFAEHGVQLQIEVLASEIEHAAFVVSSYTLPR